MGSPRTSESEKGRALPGQHRRRLLCAVEPTRTFHSRSEFLPDEHDARARVRRVRCARFLESTIHLVRQRRFRRRARASRSRRHTWRSSRAPREPPAIKSSRANLAEVPGGRVCGRRYLATASRKAAGVLAPRSTACACLLRRVNAPRMRHTLPQLYVELHAAPPLALPPEPRSICSDRFLRSCSMHLATCSAPTSRSANQRL